MRKLYQCAGCQKLFDHWKDLSMIEIDNNENGYYLCDDCIASKTIIEKKDLNTSEVKI